MNQGNGAQTEQRVLTKAEKEEGNHSHISRYRRCLGKNISENNMEYIRPKLWCCFPSSENRGGSVT
jgi:hypothetical protein